MPNSKKTKIAQVLALILCLGFHSKMMLADVQKNKNIEMDSANKKSDSDNLPVVDEAFLLFLSEVDIQDGVEVDPLDMLDVSLENPIKPLNTDLKNTEMKRIEKIENTKENK